MNKSKLVCSLSISLLGTRSGLIYQRIWYMKIWTPGHQHQLWLWQLWLLLDHRGAENPLWLAWKKQKCIREERLLCGCKATVGLQLIMRYSSCSNYSPYPHFLFLACLSFVLCLILCWLMLSDIESRHEHNIFDIKATISADPACWSW